MSTNSAHHTVKASRLRKLMWVYFIAMALPTAVLIYKSYDQLKWEAFYQHRQLAEEFSKRIDQTFNELVLQEESRSFGDYAYTLVGGNNEVNYFERSPLSSYPVTTDTPGIVGYFQIDAEGAFSTPLVPVLELTKVPITPEQSSQYGLSEEELEQRMLAQVTIEEVLSRNKLVAKQEVQNQPVSQIVVSGSGAEFNTESQLESLPVSQFGQDKVAKGLQATNQAAFDRLSELKSIPSKLNKKSEKNDDLLDRLAELEKKSPYKKQVGEREFSSKKKKESLTPTTIKNKEESLKRKVGNKKTTRERSLKDGQGRFIDEKNDAVINNQISRSSIQIFESEIDPFEISLLESGHFVLYRKVWREGRRYIQGLLLEQSALINGLIEQSFDDSLLSEMSDLTVIYQGNALANYSNAGQAYSLQRRFTIEGDLLYRTRYSAPFDQLENVFTIRHLPAGPGGRVIVWMAFIMTLVLCAGFYLLYRLSLRNLALVDQQQNFVSAVSHELKTPLTSIRMYGEILQQGWADEDKKKGYYRYIFDESERLTRLINNVLAMARMTRNETSINLKVIGVSELVDMIQSKVDSQVEHSNFKLKLAVDDSVASSEMQVDPDIFAQIIINLVDNAVKFAAQAERKVIDITVDQHLSDTICFSVRDYGPGIDKEHMKKVFGLFYRAENELTRETMGTGIGLALVKQLTSLMQGKIDVVNCEPGVEFRLVFAEYCHTEKQ